MPELDERLRLLQGQAHEWAAEMRPLALELDADPDAVRRHLDLPAMSRVATLQIPPEYTDDPLRIGPHRYYLMSALERVVFFEEGAWGDLGMMLASPGAPMAGVLVAALGSPQQQDYFFSRVQQKPTWTFFALTEPAGGSDAVGLRTALTDTDDGRMRLDGAKRYVGNAVRGELGVVFARSGPGPLGLAAVVVDAAADGFKSEPLDTLGVRAAQIGGITLDSVLVPRERVLGTHLSATRRGMWGWLRTFHLLRPVVAIMGVGLARATYEYVRDNRSTLTSWDRDRLDAMARRIEGVRRLTRRAAQTADHDPDDGHLGAAAKVAAARLACDCTRAALTFFPAGARLEHPLLDKLARDARSVEYMEGTTNVQRLGLFGTLSRRRLATVPEP
ncbi:acyl-CoA dehydrogenase family protein [Streptomyces sp. NPDC020731]|uniref:acyl-CoA dehydrogenase family protein n=1 Tax=Streptomyces sp. NPDC020731 TaxID=3365085 RepID=UPI0037ABBD38